MQLQTRTIEMLGRVAPASWRSGRLSILMFHRVVDAPDPLAPDATTLVALKRKFVMLRRCFNVVPLAEGIERLFDGTLPPRAVAITFDDGYRDNATLALPVLQQLGITATFFVATGYLNEGLMWNDKVIEIIRTTEAEHIDLPELGIHRLPLSSYAERRAAAAYLIERIKEFAPALRSEALDRVARNGNCILRNDLMMSVQQVAELHRAGMGIGCHTRSHPILSRISPIEARAEIDAGRSDLEAIIDAPVALFAYPNGIPGFDYDSRHLSIIREAGFNAAVSTAWGVASANSDRFQLPRFTPWDASEIGFGARLWASRRLTDYKVAL